MKTRIREIIQTVLLSLLILLLVRAALQNTQVLFNSMVPTLQAGELVLVNRLVYERINLRDIVDKMPIVKNLVNIEREETIYFPFGPPNRGDIIVFQAPHDPERDFVKRIIGIPGDSVEIRSGMVYVNNEPQNEPYVTSNHYANYPKTTVGTNAYFVLGDNRRASDDSRAWGTVPLKNIIGKVWIGYWPVNRFHVF